MASSSSPTINSLTHIYKQRFTDDEVYARLRAYANLKYSGIAGLAEAEKEMADSKFAEEHPELGEVCL